MPVNMDKLVSLDRAKEIKTTENGMIATVEASSTASKAYAVGDYFYYTGKLYKATAAIASGGTITPGTNCALAKLGDDVGDLKSALSTIPGYDFFDSWSENHYYLNTKNGTVVLSEPTSTSSQVRCQYVPCQEGDTFTVVTSGADGSRAWAFVSAPENGVCTVKRRSAKNYSTPEDGLVLIAEQDEAYLVVNDTTLQGTVSKGVGLNITLNDLQTKVNTQALIFKGTIERPAVDDFNDVTDVGTYRFNNNNATNTPRYNRPFSQRGILIVVPSNTETRFAQLAIGVESNVFYSRTYYQSWTDWAQHLTTSYDANAMSYKGSPSSSTDLNDIDNIGTYSIPSVSSINDNTKHRPTRNEGVLIVSMPSGGTRQSQIFVDVTKNEVFTRTRWSGVWDNWSSLSNHMLPKSIGVYNVVRRALQMTQIEYTTKAVLPAQEGDFPSGDTFHGLPYSSTRVEQNYVPNAVSLETFMTAIQNPNSYVYTKQSYAPNSKTYYGSVCSSMVAYCYGIDDVIPTTVAFDTYPGFHPLPVNAQNPQGLQLGDMLNKSNYHIMIVTDILTDGRGTVKAFQLAQATPARCKTGSFTPAQIQSYINSGYIPYRYDYIDLVPYEESQWIHPLSDEPVNPVWNENIMPRRGDKANWRYGEDIEIDIDAGDYTNYVVIDRNTETQAYTGDVASVITLTDVPAGEYEMYLTDGTNNSDSAYFTVQNPSITYTADGNGNVVVAWTPDDISEASSILWVNNKPDSSDYQATRAFHVLTDAEKTAHTATVTPPNMSSSEAPGGVWGIRMMFKTEFGLFASDIETIQVTS